ncbi:hypothetical protein [Streptomyces sp. P17]|uniref:hypothetical protein n=1 Tax=Streptomyces sp. P17 TaxID=3074716 RepID=UPI0037DDA310
MHNTLTEHARCLYGDEYRPTPECGLEPCPWLVLPQRPDESALMREAAKNLRMHGPLGRHRR